MFHIIQSNQISRLFDYLLNAYQQKATNIFEPFIVIVPSMVMGDWLQKQLADRTGISTLVITEFWGRYQWSLMQQVLEEYANIYPKPKDTLEVPKVAVLSKNVMQWRIFGYLTAYYQQILTNNQHPLYSFIEPLSKQHHVKHTTDSHDSSSFIKNPHHVISFLADDRNLHLAKNHSVEQRLWQFSADMASMFSRYITYRPNWLDKWSDNHALPIEKMLTMKDKKINQMENRFGDDEIHSPEWLVTHYVALEKAQRFLWHTLFADTYRYRQDLENLFWQVLHHQQDNIKQKCRQRLPKQLIFFTVQQLPKTELQIMQRLAQVVDITLLHYNPSQLFWADIVDKNWLAQQKIINPQSVYYKDYGHTLLSRFGKQSREVFAMLAALSGNEFGEIDWHDDFIDIEPTNLLTQIQQDILMLEEHNSQQKMLDIVNQLEQRHFLPHRQWQIKQSDNSLSIHHCHSMVRQLEVLRGMLIGWLNFTDNPDHHENRQLSDILVLLPDIEKQQMVIESIFPAGIGSDGYELPAKVTGVMSKEVSQLWTAISGFYHLLNQTGSRFERGQVFDWLMLPALYESYDLSHQQMSRACELLEQANFIRGFDELHLKQTLHQFDDDYRFSFAYALERLVAGWFMPQAKLVYFGRYTNQHGDDEHIEPLKNVQLSDISIIATLCDIYQQLHQFRDLNQQLHTAETWLEGIEKFIHQKFTKFQQTNALKTIWSAQNVFKKNIYANQGYYKFQSKRHTNEQYKIQPEKLKLKLSFILNSIENELANQQVSAEPSGVITFGRIGAVRNLPYKLVVMLNLNLTDFPKRETHHHYNLMQASLGQVGDRFREDDDLGAFLDAILCAKEACWLFYNGSSHHDIYEYLPASPVQELIAFLQTDIDWQSQHLEPHSLQNPNQMIYDWLVTKHPALPFDESYFTKQDPENLSNSLYQHKRNQQSLYPPAPMWFDVFQQLSHRQSNQYQSIFKIWQLSDLQHWYQQWQQHQSLSNHNPTENLYLDLNRLIWDLQNPAKTFLRSQKIHHQHWQKDSKNLETIELDSLQHYQTHQILLQNICDHTDFDHHLQQLKFSDLMPAGVARYQNLSAQSQQIFQHLRQFIEKLQNLINTSTIINQPKLKTYLNHIDINQRQMVQAAIAKLITPCRKQKLAIDGLGLTETQPDLLKKPNFVQQKLFISAEIPDNDHATSYWINYLPNSGREKHQLHFWLNHLCWQVLRQTTAKQAKQQDGFSLWQFSHQACYYLPAIESHVAQQYLQDWQLFWHLSKQTLIILPPAIAIHYLKKQPETQDNKKLLSNWHNNTKQLILEHQAEHEIWQFLLQNHDADKAILPFLQTFAEKMYQPFINHLVQISE